MATFNINADVEIRVIGEVASQQKVNDILEFLESIIYPNEVSKSFDVSEWADICHKVTNVYIEDEQGRSREVKGKTRKRNILFVTFGFLAGSAAVTVQSEGLLLALLALAALSVLLSFLLKKTPLRKHSLKILYSKQMDFFIGDSKFELKGEGFIGTFIDAGDIDEALHKFNITLGLEEARQDEEITLAGVIYMERVKELYKIDQDCKRIGPNLFSRPLKFIKWLSSPTEVLFFIFLPITLATIFRLIYG